MNEAETFTIGSASGVTATVWQDEAGWWRQHSATIAGAKLESEAIGPYPSEQECLDDIPSLSVEEAAGIAGVHPGTIYRILQDHERGELWFPGAYKEGEGRHARWWLTRAEAVAYRPYARRDAKIDVNYTELIDENLA